MKLLVTGGSGYVGAAILRRAPKDWQVAATYFRNPIRINSVAALRVDLRDARGVNELFAQFHPAVVIHTVALMMGDAMLATNIDGSRHIARAARECHARLIHLSSDVIFDGEHAPYDEDSPPQPITLYAESKVRAESVVREVFPVIARSGFYDEAISTPQIGDCFAQTARNDKESAVIVRTSLVYGFDPLDPRTRQTLNGEMPRLFTDEFRCPIFVADLADALLELAQNDFTGILHVAGTQRVSRYDFGLRLTRVFDTAPRFAPALSASHSSPRPRDCALRIALARKILRTRLRGVDEVLAGLFPTRS